MEAVASRPAPRSRWLFMRRVFAAWSIGIPASFEEAFVREDSYWHAWDESRSVSLTSMTIDDHGRPVGAAEILRVMKPGVTICDRGEPVSELPAGLRGCACYGPVEQPARASRALCGLLVIDGRVLIVTITSDDLDWAKSIWLSIQSHGAPAATIRPRSTRKGHGRRRR